MAVSMVPNSGVQIDDSTLYADFIIESADDLSGFDSWGENNLANGCTAWCPPSVAWYGFSGGTWHSQSGE